MSTKGEVLRHPVNGSTEQTWNGFSWPAFFFGVVWLLVKGLYGHFLINLVIVVVTAGVAAPIVWIVYGFIGNGSHKASLFKKGYLTGEQWEARNKPSVVVQSGQQSVPIDRLAQLRELAELRDRGVLTEQEFSIQKAKVLAN